MLRSASDFVEDLMESFGRYVELRREGDKILRQMKRMQWWGCLIWFWRDEWTCTMHDLRMERRKARHVRNQMERLIAEMERRAGDPVRYMYLAMLDFERATREALNATCER